MRITTRQFGEAIVLNLHGPVVGHEASELLQTAVKRQALDSTRVVVLNLTQVKAIDAGGLRALSAVADLTRRASGRLRLTGINERLSHSIVSWLMSTASTFPTVEDAIDDVRRGLECAAAKRALPRERLWTWFRQFRHLHPLDRMGETGRIEPLNTAASS